MVKIKKNIEEKLRQEAKNRCGYCLNPQELLPFKLEIEHLFPIALGGETVEENLWLACRECNAHKSKKIKSVDFLTGKLVKLFNPRTQIWKEHF
jgi:5-methylcytosine-specific restriction endonuclease McrA